MLCVYASFEESFDEMAMAMAMEEEKNLIT